MVPGEYNNTLVSKTYVFFKSHPPSHYTSLPLKFFGVNYISLPYIICMIYLLVEVIKVT